MTMLLHTRGFLLRLVNLCLVSSTAVKDSWMMTLQPAEEGMCLPPHLPRSLSPAVDSFVLWLCCQNRRKSLDHRRVAETQILSNPTLNSHTCTSSLWRVMMGLTNTPAELWFSLQKKKSPSVNSNQFSIVAKLSRSAVYLKTYLTSPSSSPPPTLWTFSMVSTEAQPQVFSTFSCWNSFGNDQAHQLFLPPCIFKRQLLPQTWSLCSPR